MNLIVEIKNEPFNQIFHKNTNVDNEKITISYFIGLSCFWAK